MLRDGPAQCTCSCVAPRSLDLDATALQRQQGGDVAKQPASCPPAAPADADKTPEELETAREFAFFSRYPVHEHVFGPLQRSEAVALYGILRTVRPLNVLEFGFYEGDSCEVMAAATAGSGARITSIDINEPPPDKVAHIREQYPHVDIVIKSQDEYMPPVPVDFLSIDASHNLTLNQRTWKHIKGHLAENVVV
jgi:hypothetical protein